MLELKLEKESLFLKALEAMLDLVDVASVDCSDAGLELRALDTEQKAAIALHFPREEFQHYSCDKVLSMGIPIDDMVKSIRCFDNNETITIVVENKSFDTITFLFKLPQENNTTGYYHLPVVEATSHRFNNPDLQVIEQAYQAIVQMPSAEFMRVCKYLSIIGGGDGCISVNETGLKFFAFGKSGCVNINYMQPTSDVTYDMRAPVSLTLDLKYMYSIAKASSLFDQVKIYLFTTQFLIFECKIRQMNIKYFLELKGSAEENKGSSDKDKGSAEVNGSGEGTTATMLELKLAKEKENLFLNALDAMLDLADVASVSCSSTGLKLRAMDTKHVAAIELLFSAENFQHYHYYHCKEVFSMGIQIDNMVKAVRCADKNDAVTIKVVGKSFEAITITLSFESPQENNTTTYYTLPVVDTRSHCFRILDLQLESNYETFVEMPSAEFMRVCKYLSNISSYGHVSVNVKGLKFSATGGSERVNINYKQPEKATAMQPEKATATVVTYMQAPISMFLDLKYTYSIAKASARFDQLKVGLSTKFLMVECKIGQMDYIRYFLVPERTIFKRAIFKRQREDEEIKKRMKWNRDDKDEGNAEKDETETDD